ncbi:H repeat-containing Rhs element protein [Escherichia coli]|uniref:H repeat-containing Rhs element protein n=1 Tax=Escherichia coli TaxID=562 RepID=A0A376MTJ0_ECOLX|nr:H repeat-containing Rhs element protein [Escherichia coli]
MVIFKMVFLFTIPSPELYPVSVLQNFTSALLTGCVTAILQMIKTLLQLMEKTLRHSYDKSRRRGAIHVISAFSTMHSLVIGQIRTDKKSNEITAIPELLNMLDIKGKIITTDAMGCQKDIAEKIQKQGGDYLFAVKGNQGRLNKAFEEKFPLKELNNPEHDSYAISEKSHGREEIRLHIVCDVPDELIDFTFEWKGQPWTETT